MPCATNRLMAGTIVVPAFWRVEWCHAGPDRTSRSGAIPENAWTHILTDRQTRPANYFSPTHQWKSSFIERSMLKHLNVHSLRFWIMKYPAIRLDNASYAAGYRIVEKSTIRPDSLSGAPLFVTKLALGTEQDVRKCLMCDLPVSLPYHNG